MAEGLTAEQLYRDLVQAHQRPEVPEGAFTAQQFADDAGFSKSIACDKLLRLVQAGELERLWDRGRYWYYFTAD